MFVELMSKYKTDHKRKKNQRREFVDLPFFLIFSVLSVMVRNTQVD